MTVEEILQSMVDRKEALGLSYQQIGDRAGYCASGAHHAMRQSGNPRLATLCDLAEALGLEIRVVEKEEPVKTYLCDPEKNTDCGKTACFEKGGPCEMTTNPAAARGWT